MLQRIRDRAQNEKGFTLIELLVVILIIGILAAIAIPAFLSQRTKGQDAAAKSLARTGQTSIETCATDNNGSYTGCNTAKVQGIEPALNDSKFTSATPNGTGDGYTITATSASGNTATITKANSTSAVTRGGTVGSW